MISVARGARRSVYLKKLTVRLGTVKKRYEGAKRRRVQLQHNSSKSSNKKIKLEISISAHKMVLRFEIASQLNSSNI